MIENPYNVEIEKKQIYDTIWEFRVPEEYYFESYGTSYGNTIYGRIVLDNHYIIKKRDNEDNINKDSK